MGTASISKTLWGDELYQQRARDALPILVRQALAGEPIYYSDLAEEMNMPNPRNLNYVLGCVGQTLKELSKQRSEDIPQIQCLVINKSTRLPGEGFDEFVDEIKNKSLTLNQKRIIVDSIFSKIYLYDKWLKVLNTLNLQQPNYPKPIKTKVAHGSGESQKHKDLKSFIANNPTVIGLPSSCDNGEIEYCLPSGDTLDVKFSWKNTFIAVEVKSSISDVSDINRGLFQCVKYQAVSEAMLATQGKPKNVRTVLVLESKLPTELVCTKNILGIEVIENVVIES